MGKKKRTDGPNTVGEITNLNVLPTGRAKRLKRDIAKDVTGKKAKTAVEVVPTPAAPAPQPQPTVTISTKNDFNNQKTYLDYSSSSSDSDSEKNSKIDKKSASDSNSESDSDSSDSDSPSEKNEANSKEDNAELPVTTKNSIVNLPAVKSYQPPPPTAAKSSSSDSYHSDTEEEDKKRRKKQKKLMKIQLNKKTRQIHPRIAAKDDVDIKDDEDDCPDNIPSNSDDVPDWPEPDYNELLRRMESQIPLKDNQKFDSRAAKLDWSKIAFGDYTPDESYDTWVRISKRIRRFRTLAEMISDAKYWVTKPWTNFYRGPKKNRHPDMPSRPLSTYMIYYLEHKDTVASENPGLDMTQVSKIISEKYKTIGTAERERYTEKAAKERQIFEEKLSEFYKDHPEMQVQPHSKTSSRELSSKGPRKPSVPFKLFYQDQLKMYGDEALYDKKAIEDSCKEKWRQLNDKKKLIWINWALEDSKRYEDELKVYMMEHPEFVAPTPSKSVLNKDERTIKERLAGKPVKPPNSAYSYFSRVMLQSDEHVKSIPPKLRMAEISRKWKVISDGQKTRYEEKVRELQDQYKLEFASYLEGLPPDQREAELLKTQPKRKAAQRIERAEPVERARRVAVQGGRRRKEIKKEERTKRTTNLNLYRGEPEPPPVRAFDLFLQSFLDERPAGTTEATRMKEAPKYWEILPESKKESYRKKLGDLKQKYIHDYEVFLKELSPEELKEFSLLKAKAKKIEEAQEQLSHVNGTLTDSESESDKNESSSESDSEGCDSGKSSKSTSGSEESEA